jgi:tetratricopeptide (TPR) repeat protein
MGSPDPRHVHRAAAIAVLLTTFIIYNATKAPTLSFWDCGEFIACSSILGIPHPPGSPVYILLGRLFSIIPFHADISARVNMLSAITGALAAMLAFLITFRLIRYWWSDDQFTGWKKGAAYIGALVGTGMFAFGRTNWSNCVEAEVYMPAMLILMFIIWLFLQWLDRRQEKRSDRYLVAITYLGFLSAGIHMTTFLFLPAIFLMVILFSERLRRDFRFYITGTALLLISLTLDSFLVATGVWLIVCIIAYIMSRQYAWKFALFLVIAAVVGLSSQLFTPIRSAQKPAINQNNPASSFAAFQKFIERKQYGEELMVERALTRRGTWANQLGTHERMGFWGFFSEQYGINGRPFAFLFVVGLLGIFELARRRPALGWPFLFMIVLGTVFLVWYMNFADGTHQDPVTGEGHTEVRDRDYFFTPGFILFGMAIGMGVAGLMEMARESLLGKLRSLRTPAMIILSLLVLLAAVPVKANYFYCDRSRNFIPYDFAANLLNSCDPNAILYIGGDNDTFPLWCLQEVYGMRRDVAAVNLALANTTWYIKQIRDQMKIPLRWSDGAIDSLRHFLPTPGRQFYPVQNQVTDEILEIMYDQSAKRLRRPINYAITAGTEIQQYRGRSLADNTIMQGMVVRLELGERLGSIDMARHHDLLWNTFRYRSLADAGVYKDERTRALSGNYATCFILLADSLRQMKRYNEAIAETEKAIEVVPFEDGSYNYLVRLYVEAGYEDRIPEVARRAPADHLKDIYFIWGMSHRELGHLERAREILKMTLDSFPTYDDAFQEYARVLYDMKQIDELEQVLRNWLTADPTDANARRMLEELLRVSRQPASPPAPSPAGGDS